MLRMRKRVLSMLLAGIVCAAAIPGGSVAVSAQEELMDTKEVMDLDEFVYEAVEKGDTDSKGYTDYLEPSLEGEEGLSVQLVPKGAGRANDLKYGDYTYVIQEDGTVEISRYSGTEKNITVPEYIEGKKVTSIAYFAFQSCHTLESMVIPDGVVSIGRYAISLCDNLKNITIPESVTVIEAEAFWGSALEHVVIPKDVTIINLNYSRNSI